MGKDYITSYLCFKVVQARKGNKYPIRHMFSTLLDTLIAEIILASIDQAWHRHLMQNIGHILPILRDTGDERERIMIQETLFHLLR